jgi:PAS domain S-box-containing protein
LKILAVCEDFHHPALVRGVVYMAVARATALGGMEGCASRVHRSNASMKLFSSPLLRSPLLRYGMALALVGIVALVRTSLTPILQDRVAFLAFVPAVALAAFLGGLIPGLVATAAAAVAADVLILRPYHGWKIASLSEAMQIGWFVVGGMIISALSEALHRYRRRGDALLAGITDCYVSLDELGHLREVNERAVEFFGKRRDELLGKSIRDVFGHDCGREIERRALESAAQNVSAHFECRVGAGDQQRWVEVHAYPEGAGMRLFFRDITARMNWAEQLRTSEERYRTFVRQSTEGIWRFELDEPLPVDQPPDALIDSFYRLGYLAECNDAFARMYGFESPQQIVGARLGELLIRSDPNNVEYLRSFIVAGFKLSDAESHERDRAGNDKYFLNNLVGVIEDGRMRRAWGTQRDVTESKRELLQRQRAEARLTAEHAVTRILADSDSLETAAPQILDAIRHSLHAHAGLLWQPADAPAQQIRCTIASNAQGSAELLAFVEESRRCVFERGTGLPGRVWAAHAPAWITELTQDENFPRRAAAARAGLRSGMSFPIGSGDEFFGAMEFFTEQPMQPDPALVNMMGAIGSEIAQFVLRRRAEVQLRQSQRELADLVENATVGLHWVAADGTILWANKAELAMLGYAHDEYVGRNIGEFHADAEVIDSILTCLSRGETLRDYEARLRCKDGSIKHVLIDSNVLWDDGRFVHTRCFTRDVPDQKRAERERDETLVRERAARAESERASRAKDEFLAVLSHELRTPLAPVLLTVSLLERRAQLPADVREDLQTIRRNVELEARLIDDLLDLTRIARGKLTLDMRTTDVHLLLRSAIEICHRDDAIRLKTQFGATRHFVRADPARLQQVFWNLLSNAHKFTPAGGSVTVRTFNDADDRIVIEVADTGIGIDPELQPRIFSAFEQGAEAKSRRFGGLGLGLAISKALVNGQGGTLSAFSEGKGKGSTFTARMPTVAVAPHHETAAAPAPAAAAEQFPATAGSQEQLRILVVEDDEPTRQVMARLLGKLGYDTVTASSKASAIEAASRNSFDLLISDLGLPDGSGHELMRQIRQQYARIRGIALSGYGMEEDLKKSSEAGFHEHLTKPVDLVRLEAAIRRATKPQLVS